MKTFFSILTILVIICATCVVTCPTKEAHTEAIMELITDVVEDEIGNEMNKNTLSMVVYSLSMELVEVILVNDIDIDNYFLFSIGKAGEDVVSVGIMNHVFTISKEDILSKLKEE